MGKGALWRDNEVDALLDIVAKYLPLEQEDWIQCEYAYNQEKEVARKRSAESMKRKFSALKNSDKPTGIATTPPRIQRAKDIQKELESRCNTVIANGHHSSTPEEASSQQQQLTTEQAETRKTMQDVRSDPTVIIRSLSPSVSLSASASASLSTEFGLESTHENVSTEENVTFNPVLKPTHISTTFTPIPTVLATTASIKGRESQTLVPANRSSAPKEILHDSALISLDNVTLTHSARKRKRDSDKVLEAIESINTQMLEFQNNIVRFIRDATQSKLDMREKELKMEIEYRRQVLDMQKQAMEISRLDLEEKRLDREERRQREDRMQNEKREDRRERIRDRIRERDKRRQERCRILNTDTEQDN